MEILQFLGEGQSSPKIGQPHFSGWPHSQNKVKSMSYYILKRRSQSLWIVELGYIWKELQRGVGHKYDHNRWYEEFSRN